jgi:hypothetical protein
MAATENMAGIFPADIECLVARSEYFPSTIAQTAQNCAKLG